MCNDSTGHYATSFSQLSYSITPMLVNTGWKRWIAPKFRLAASFCGYYNKYSLIINNGLSTLNRAILEIHFNFNPEQMNWKSFVLCFGISCLLIFIGYIFLSILISQSICIIFRSRLAGDICRSISLNKRSIRYLDYQKNQWSQ